MAGHKDLDEAVNEWIKRLDEKTKEIGQTRYKEALRKAAFFCEGEAKRLAQTRVYERPIPTGPGGKPLWKRTGLYKATIGSGLEEKTFKYVAFVYAAAPYAWKIEFGYSSMRGRYVVSDAVFRNQDQIRSIITNYLYKSFS